MAGWGVRAWGMEPVNVQGPGFGSYSAALAWTAGQGTLVESAAEPPATSTWPLARSVAAWPPPAVCREPVMVQVPAVGAAACIAGGAKASRATGSARNQRSRCLVFIGRLLVGVVRVSTCLVTGCIV